MNKCIKLIFMILTIITLLCITTPISYGENSIVGVIEGAGSSKENVSIDDGVYTISSTIINWIWSISIIVSIIVLMIIGIKYISGGTQEKADYKKSLIPFFIGTILVVFATTIVKILFASK